MRIREHRRKRLEVSKYFTGSRLEVEAKVKSQLVHWLKSNLPLSVFRKAKNRADFDELRAREFFARFFGSKVL
jgi:hypothetical protein